MKVEDDCVRRRAYRIWEAEGRPPGKHHEHWERARREIEGEFRRTMEHCGDVDHRLNPPLHVDEIQDPALYRELGPD